MDNRLILQQFITCMKCGQKAWRHDALFCKHKQSGHYSFTIFTDDTNEYIAKNAIFPKGWDEYGGVFYTLENLSSTDILDYLRFVLYMQDYRHIRFREVFKYVLLNRRRETINTIIK